ncbi:MAG: ABC transporter permease subunit [Candidatus Latescibacteria bacterium]|nr:ABC transporter permease subunit [Candidatus Latescibacterota bacterium]
MGSEGRVLRFLGYAVLSLMAVTVLTPLVWTLLSSLRPVGDIFSHSLPSSLADLTWENYQGLYAPIVRAAGAEQQLFPPIPYGRFFLNSVFVSTGFTLLALFFGSLGGFGFGKYEFRGKKALFMVLMGSMMIPFHVGLIPLYSLMAQMGWINTFQALIIPGSANAFSIFLMRQYVATVPDSLIDSARIDGCSEFGIYWRVALPLLKPAVGALTILLFMWRWNDFLWPSMVLLDETHFTLQVGLKSLISTYQEEYGVLLAGTTLAIVPVVLLFLWMQREFVEGITLGAVKE